MHKNPRIGCFSFQFEINFTFSLVFLLFKFHHMYVVMTSAPFRCLILHTEPSAQLNNAHEMVVSWGWSKNIIRASSVMHIYYMHNKVYNKRLHNAHDVLGGCWRVSYPSSLYIPLTGWNFHVIPWCWLYHRSYVMHHSKVCVCLIMI